MIPSGLKFFQVSGADGNLHCLRTLLWTSAHNHLPCQRASRLASLKTVVYIKDHLHVKDDVTRGLMTLSAENLSPGLGLS